MSLNNADLFVPLLGSGSNGKYFNLGLNGGGRYFTGEEAFNTTDFKAYQIFRQTAAPTISVNGTASHKGYLFEAGLQANLAFGGFSISPILDAGYLSLTQSPLSVIQTTNLSNTTVPLVTTLFNQLEIQTKGLSVSPKLRLSYTFGRLGVWAEGSYLKGPTIDYTTSTLVPEGKPDKGVYEVFQLTNGAKSVATTKSIDFTSVGLNVGLSFALGGGGGKPSVKKAQVMIPFVNGEETAEKLQKRNMQEEKDSNIPPQNVSPSVGSVLIEDLANKSVSFKWTPIVLSKPVPVDYLLQVWEVKDGQNSQSVISTQKPMLQQQVNNQTSFLAKSGGNTNITWTENTNYVWQVKAIDKVSNVLGSSTPTMFNTSSCLPNVKVKIDSAVCTKLSNGYMANTVYGVITTTPVSGVTVNAITFNSVVEYPSLTNLPISSQAPSTVATSGVENFSMLIADALCKKIRVEYKISFTCLSGLQTLLCSDTLTLPCCA